MKEVYGTMALDTKRLYTTKDIMTLPDGVRAELINGQIYYMATPALIHQELLGELYYVFKHHQKENHGHCRVYTAPCAVFINQDQYNYLEPDLYIICPKEENETRLQKDGCHGAPDFVLEIVSPSSRQMDYIKKLAKYEETGVKEYWIVDPLTERIHVYRFMGEFTYAQYTFEDTVPVGIYGNLAVNFKELDFQI